MGMQMAMMRTMSRGGTKSQCNMALNNAYKMYQALINKWTLYGRRTLDMGDAVRGQRGPEIRKL